MKKLIKTIFLLLIILTVNKNLFAAGTTLSTGDIAFIGLNSDGNDDFSFVLLKNILSGTTINITDKGWNDGTNSFYVINGDYTGLVWTATSNMNAGAIVNIRTSLNGTLAPENLIASVGTVSGEILVSYSGDQLFIYQGTEASPTFIAGIHYNVETTTTSGNWDGAATSTATSALPNQLTNGTNAIWVYDTDLTEKDNFIYNCSTTSGTPSVLRSAINNIGNWNIDASNITPYTLNPFPCTFSVTAVEAPTATTNAASSVTASSATLNGTINANNASTTVTFQYGLTTAYGTTVTAAESPVTGTTATSVSYGLAGLSPNTIFHYRVVGVNSEGTTNGSDQSFTTSNASITFADGSAYTPTVTGGSDRAVGRFSLTGDVAGANLTAASIKLNGARTGMSNFKLWRSTDASFDAGSDTQLGSTVAADPGDGSSVSYSSFTGAIGTSATYFFLTADVDVAATGLVQGVIVANANLTLANGTLTGSITNATLSNSDVSLPVEIAAFTAKVNGNTIVLNWQTASETGNLGFILERAEGNSAWKQVASYKTDSALKGHGNSSSTTNYNYTDNTIKAAAEYRYRLADVNTTGTVTMHSPISVTITALPQSTEMFNAYPNPFNPETTINYELHKDSQVTITVYDLLGRKVKTLIDEQQAAGSYQALWNGTDINGAQAASGAYLIRMETHEITLTHKVLLLK